MDKSSLLKVLTAVVLRRNRSPQSAFAQRGGHIGGGRFRGGSGVGFLGGGAKGFRGGAEFWRDEIQLTEAVEFTQAKRVGHQQITDAYLLGLAVHKKGKLVTLDRNVPALLGQTSEKRDLVVVL